MNTFRLSRGGGKPRLLSRRRPKSKTQRVSSKKPNEIKESIRARKKEIRRLQGRAMPILIRLHDGGEVTNDFKKRLVQLETNQEAPAGKIGKAETIKLLRSLIEYQKQMDDKTRLLAQLEKELAESKDQS